ncbi:helix-turn-helix domain-containing protein [Clostridia bacterium OttesenSCG-928-O13]|nr:helix-turn-helix domain-containing protein [Clostridia bacterium OttesenSCG-928-O13]
MHAVFVLWGIINSREVRAVKERYTIGETAKLFNISVQTLRFYEKMGLITPDHVNPKTGYRYYSPGQFHIIDRIHYLKELGLSLKDIKDIIHSGQVEDLQFFLRKNLADRKSELAKLQDMISDLQWYINYFTYMDTKGGEDKLYVANLEERFMLSAPCSPNEPFEDIEMHLTQLRSRKEFQSLRYRRHYSFLIEFEDMMKQRFAPISASIYLKERPQIPSPFITTLPAGEYLCFTGQLRLHQWRSDEVWNFFENSEYEPVFAVANEYEDNLVEYSETPYEIQVYLNKKNNN